MDSRSYVDDFLLLKRRPFRDRDDIVDGIGRSSGRLSAVVRGQRRAKGGGGLLEPPVLLQVSLRPASGLCSLSQPVLVNGFSTLRRELPSLLAAGFLSRLFMASLAERSSEPEVFELLRHLFLTLGQGVPPAICGLWGQERLLTILGLSPVLEACAECRAVSVAGFSAADGGVLCAGCYRGNGFSLSLDALAFCRRLRESELREFSVLPNPAVIRSAGRLYKEHFQEHLGLGDHLFRRVLPPLREEGAL